MAKLNLMQVRRIKTAVGEVSAMKIGDAIWRNVDPAGNALPVPVVILREEPNDS